MFGELPLPSPFAFSVPFCLRKHPDWHLTSALFLSCSLHWPEVAIWTDRGFVSPARVVPFFFWFFKETPHPPPYWDCATLTLAHTRHAWVRGVGNWFSHKHVTCGACPKGIDRCLGSLRTPGKEKSSLHGLAEPGGREDGTGVISLPSEKSLCGDSWGRRAELEQGDGGLPSLPRPGLLHVWCQLVSTAWGQQRLLPQEVINECYFPPLFFPLWLWQLPDKGWDHLRQPALLFFLLEESQPDSLDNNEHTVSPPEQCRPPLRLRGSVFSNSHSSLGALSDLRQQPTSNQAGTKTALYSPRKEGVDLVKPWSRSYYRKQTT